MPIPCKLVYLQRTKIVEHHQILIFVSTASTYYGNQSHSQSSTVHFFDTYSFKSNHYIFQMAKLISLSNHNSHSGPSVPPAYFVHNQIYANMFRHDDETMSNASCEKDDTFPSSPKMQHPASRKPRAPLATKFSVNERQPISSARSSARGPCRTDSPDDKPAPPRRTSRQTVPTTTTSEEDLQIRQFYLDAKKHQAATARVTTLQDFQNMTFTLPAAKKQANALKASKSQNDVLSPSKSCPFMPIPGQYLKNPQRIRSTGPMFRGKTSRTASAAAGSFVAEAVQADQYYCKDTGRPIRQNKKEPTITTPVVNHVEEEEESKQRWKLLFPKKWHSHRSAEI